MPQLEQTNIDGPVKFVMNKFNFCIVLLHVFSLVFLSKEQHCLMNDLR